MKVMFARMALEIQLNCPTENCLGGPVPPPCPPGRYAHGEIRGNLTDDEFLKDACP